MNRIRHGRKNVAGKQKFELILKLMYLYKSPQASNKARLSGTERFIELWHEEESLWNNFGQLNIRQEKEKTVGRMSEKLEIIISLKCLFESSCCE